MPRIIRPNSSKTRINDNKIALNIIINNKIRHDYKEICARLVNNIPNIHNYINKKNKFYKRPLIIKSNRLSLYIINFKAFKIYICYHDIKQLTNIEKNN